MRTLEAVRLLHEDFLSAAAGKNDEHDVHDNKQYNDLHSRAHQRRTTAMFRARTPLPAFSVSFVHEVLDLSEIKFLKVDAVTWHAQVQEFFLESLYHG